MADEKKSDDYAVDMPALDRNSRAFEPPPASRQPLQTQTSLSNSPVLPILSYCGSSILMTVTNKYVLSGVDFNLNFFLLAVQVWLISSLFVVIGILMIIQSIVCVVAIQACKSMGVITYRDFNSDEARKCISNSLILPFLY